MPKEKLTAIDKTCIKSTGLIGMGECSSLGAVDVKDGKIVRIRPFHYDWKYKPEEFRPWKIEARGKTFAPPMKSLPVPFGTGYKKRVQSPNRILYPLKRVDWDPNGERNPQNRGVSKYERISWDEAVDIIAKELRRIGKKYGPEAVLAQGPGHGEEKVVHGPHGCFIHLLALLGGYTLELRNPDSWEGWYWGAKHVWGGEPVGLDSEHQTNAYTDIARNTDAILFQGCDPETTPWGFGGGHMVSRFCYWFSELGIRSIYICPDVNYGAAVHADKWIPVKPNTDAALQLAIAYQWIIDGTYDKSYVATHVVGFEQFRDYVLGKEDGIAKTAQWASEKCGIPSRIIKALARYWALHTVTIAHGLGGPYIRGAYAHEPARLEAVLLGMQGLGKPGTHQISMVEMTFIVGQGPHKVHPPTPGGVVRPAAKFAYRGHHPFIPLPKQTIPKTLLYDAIIDGHFEIFGSSYQMLPVEDQFKKYIYPMPGCSEIHMIWSDTPCFMTCWHGETMVKAWRSPKIECIISEHQWMESDCIYSDIVLPVSTKYEEDDIGDDTISLHFDTLFLSDKCIEPVGESMSDYEIACLVAEKMGLLKEYTQGKSIEDWIKFGFDTSGLPEAGVCTWEKFKEKGYFVVPTDPKWETYHAGMLDFRNDPAKHRLTTPSGKLEFYSERLAKHFPDDKERPPVPKWIEGGPGWSHDERIGGERAKLYPLLCMSNHPRWRVHAQCDDITWFHEIPTSKVRGSDGYLYEPIWIHPSDAGKRGIGSGDVVKVFNERGAVMVGAYVTERIMPGVVYIDHGARHDPLVPGELDRGGAINMITPHNRTSKNAAGMVTNGFLVEVEGVNLDELSKQYPESFTAPYDEASGLRFERILYKGEKK